MGVYCSDSDYRRFGPGTGNAAIDRVPIAVLTVIPRSSHDDDACGHSLPASQCERIGGSRFCRRMSKRQIDHTDVNAISLFAVSIFDRPLDPFNDRAGQAPAVVVQNTHIEDAGFRSDAKIFEFRRHAQSAEDSGHMRPVSKRIHGRCRSRDHIHGLRDFGRQVIHWCNTAIEHRDAHFLARHAILEPGVWRTCRYSGGIYTREEGVHIKRIVRRAIYRDVFRYSQGGAMTAHLFQLGNRNFSR